MLAKERRCKRERLLAATGAGRDRIRAEVTRCTKTPLNAAQIGEKVGRGANRYKMAKHVETALAEGRFDYRRREARIAEEATLDGLYVSGTSEPAKRLIAKGSVRRYKNLAPIERGFAALKGLDCVSARSTTTLNSGSAPASSSVCWPAPSSGTCAALLFNDEALTAVRAQCKPVAPAEPSAGGRQKKVQRRTDEGLVLHSVAPLMAELGTRGRHHCRLKSEPALGFRQRLK